MNLAPNDSGGGIVAFRERWSLGRSLGWEFKLAGYVEGNCFESKQEMMVQCRRFDRMCYLEPEYPEDVSSSIVVAFERFWILGFDLRAHVAPLLARSNLLITRDIEWANLVLGFEQLLRLGCPFVAFITDGIGNELFRVHRPFWWITSSIYAEINGKIKFLSFLHLYTIEFIQVQYQNNCRNKQFAVVENPGTFTLKDIDGNVLAETDRDQRGFSFEIFTDAGQCVIQFGSSDSSSKTGPSREIEELEVARPLTLSDRAVCVALAISQVNDYFSRHGGCEITACAGNEDCCYQYIKMLVVSDL
ncbi:hypothetical protein FEM48_Zijuj11G0075500 [Ziziphus jujuba var. spinosa]|uniref:Phospholipid scramblase n=1 Tax=Ziziphus jujuba var. spinosa TaxID=714518 RepID=A0A978UHN0_ZIZJJ|nr:hypothetical protein FEM48_Zijuj11G0075500 [Ziziphus jujuba var. spinosa]